VLLLAAAAAVAVILVVSGGNEDNTSVNTAPIPTAVALTPKEKGTASAHTHSAAAPAAKPATRTVNCDPIIGTGTQNSGKSYAVTSSATDGNPADCSEAHSVLLSALSGGTTTIGDWDCTTNPSGPTVAACTAAGDRKIQARG